MGFEAVSLVELSYRFKSYGISSCIGGWIVPHFQDLRDFKLYWWLNCSTLSSLMGFQAVSVVELFHTFEYYGIQAVSFVESFHRFKNYGTSSCIGGWIVPHFHVLWDFKLYRWLNCSTLSRLTGFQAVLVDELFHAFKSYGISSCIGGWIVPHFQVLWDFKLYLTLNCSTGSIIMGFQAVSFVELFQRFNSYGISSCIFRWIVPKVQVLWDFKLYRWFNCSTGSSLMGFQAVSVVELFHMFKSYGISNCVIGWIVSNVPDNRSVFIFKCQLVNEKSLWLELPNHKQSLTTHKTCLLSHTAARAPNSHGLLCISIGLHSPPPHRNRQQLHRCRISLCDGNPVMMLDGKIWYVLAKQPHKFLRTHSTFISLLFSPCCWNPVIKSLVIRRRRNVIALAEHTPISASTDKRRPVRVSWTFWLSWEQRTAVAAKLFWSS